MGGGVSSPSSTALPRRCSSAGRLYSSLGRFHPEVISTVVYMVAVSAAGNPMLGFAGVILGAVCAYERRITSGVLAPMLTHFFWGLVMVLALPPMFGV